MTELQQWSKKKFGNVLCELGKSRKRLEELMLKGADNSEIRKETDHMNELLYREEMLWLQRSRISWLKEGDRNTRFFHQKAVWRARRNKIKKLKNAEGVWKDTPSDMERMATSYFQELFTRDPSLNADDLINLFQDKVTADMNENLCKDFTDTEIGDALFQIGPLKAPGVDGFPARFYQRNWATLKEEVINAVKVFFVTGRMPEGVNDTAIVLIPKIEQPETLKDFRPISLCTVLYKVLAKCMVNRLRPILGELISANQSAFVPGRLITDNALVAFECMHFIEQNVNTNKDYCAYKLDLSKAYDRVDWDFLKKAMQRLGFAPRWVNWIMACVTTVSYKVKFNGTLLDSFSPSRGLRQGDPLSPFLFLFVADGLSALLQKEVENQTIEPVKICRRAPGISHLLFADDTLLFFKAKQEQAHKVKEVLEKYANSTGQLINPSKCSIMFGASCPGEVREEVKAILQVVQESFETKYLGLPTPEGRMNKGKFQSLQAKLAKSLVEWDDTHKSQAAKETLIKAVAQALTTYVMGIFKLPYGLCDELTKLIRDYWWGADKGKRKTHWISWDTMLRPKDKGGMGFRDMRLFNQALLARQAWRLIEFPNSLCSQLLKAKYYPNGFLVDTVFTGNGSSTWHAIEYGLQLLKQGVIWRVGNGANIRVWRDPWIPGTPNYKPISVKGRCRYRWVSDFLHPDGTWNVPRLQLYFLPEDVSLILKIKPSRRNDEDFLAWEPDKRGSFSVRSAYRVALENQMLQQGLEATSTRPDGRRPDWKLIWQCPVPPKVKHLGWKIAKNALATQQNKRRRGMETPATCLICGQEVEDTFHIFIRCQHARNLWLAMREVWNLPADNLLIHTGVEWLLQLLHQITEEQRVMTLMVLWRIWFAHNETTHDKALPSIEGSKRFLMSYLDSLLLIKQHPMADLEKGKMVISQAGFQPNKHMCRGEKKNKQKWMPPARGVLKLNVDGSYANDSAGAGIVIRDHDGTVILTACWQLQHCIDSTEAEIAAMELGIAQAMTVTTGRFMIESDCVEAITLIKEGTPNLTKYASRIQVVREMIREREVQVAKVDRTSNYVSHLLANLGRTHGWTRVWLRHFPQEVAGALDIDCNSTQS
jgi:hypothetical protein